MANNILTPEIIAREALMVLRNNAVMANLVHRDYSSEFVAGKGDTISIRKPATFVANEFGGSIETQTANETSVPVVMDKHLDVSFAVTSKELSLSIEDFSAQLLVPAMQAFADKVDKYLLNLERDCAYRAQQIGEEMAPADLIAARKYLTQNAAPLADRRFVVGAEGEAALLNNELFVSAEKVGDEGTALREASLGRKFGMDIYVDQNISDDIAPGIAFHKNALALVTRPLALPNGAAKAAIVNYDGFGLRVVYGYDMNTKTDTVSIDMLCGVAMLDDKLIAVVQNGAPK